MMKILSCSFATFQLSTISAHLKGIVSHKKYIYITRDFSLSLAIEMYGWPFCFSGPSLHIEYYRTLG